MRYTKAVNHHTNTQWFEFLFDFSPNSLRDHHDMCSNIIRDVRKMINMLLWDDYALAWMNGTNGHKRYDTIILINHTRWLCFLNDLTENAAFHFLQNLFAHLTE
jgi:hypothetical protein